MDSGTHLPRFVSQIRSTDIVSTFNVFQNCFCDGKLVNSVFRRITVAVCMYVASGEGEKNTGIHPLHVHVHVCMYVCTVCLDRVLINDIARTFLLKPGSHRDTCMYA